tara:strand:+ start:169 stop:561 length:393 start_codon:yes stop_codon:yes gene_type:complete
LDNIQFDEDQDDIVPEIYREHRHRFSKQPEDLEAYKRQVMYRSSHIGTKELEIILSDWLKINQDSLSYKDVEEYDHQILSVENPSLQRYLINGEGVLPEHDNKYMRILLKYMNARRIDYHGNVPSEVEWR